VAAEKGNEKIAVALPPSRKSLTCSPGGATQMIDVAAEQRAFIELYDVMPALAEFLTAFFGVAPPHDDSEPLLVPAIHREVTWEGYVSFLNAAGERLLRHSFADATLELMSPRVFERENTKAVLRRFNQMLAFETNQPVLTLGAATLASPSRCLGVEPDEAFCFVRGVPHESALFFDVDRAGPPDLVIEVGALRQDEAGPRVSAIEVDRLDLLARLGVREVWYVDRSHVQILHNPDGQLIAADRSQYLPAATGPMISRHLRNRLRIGENACITEFVAEALAT
jgi:Uma2 family endonuclease